MYDTYFLSHPLQFDTAVERKKVTEKKKKATVAEIYPWIKEEVNALLQQETNYKDRVDKYSRARKSSWCVETRRQNMTL